MSVLARLFHLLGNNQGPSHPLDELGRVVLVGEHFRWHVLGQHGFGVMSVRTWTRGLGPLLTQLAQAGFGSPIITPLGAEGPSSSVRALAGEQASDLPDDWRVVRERDGESYRWPSGRDRYSPYRVFIGTTRAEGAVQIGLGETIRKNKWGRDRKYVVAFLSGGSPQRPLVEFVAADDYEHTRELVAVIRGSDGGRRMYGAADVLPTLYTERFRTQTYSDRVNHPGAWNKFAVVAREDDDQAILDHALIQSRRRDRT